MSDRQPVLVFLEMESPEVHRIMGFQTYGRSVTLPYGAVWVSSGEWEREATDANIFAEIQRACPLVGFAGLPLPRVVSYKRLTVAEIPTDRTYRDALKHDGTTLVFDMVKSREIHLTHLRQARTTELGELDAEWMKFMGQGDTAAAAVVEAKRQILRDGPQTLPVDEAKTIEELKMLWPIDLPPWA